MTFYADLPARRTRQILADVGVLLWVVLWVRAGLSVRETILGAMAPALQLETAGESLQGSLGAAAERVGAIPLLGSTVAGPFESAADAAESVRRAGEDLAAFVERTALLTGLATALVPVLLALVPWLVIRVRFARRARALQALLSRDEPLELLALRALATQPVTVLTRVSPTAAHDWRTGRRDVVERLAELELRSAGVDLTARHREGLAGGTGEPLPRGTQ